MPSEIKQYNIGLLGFGKVMRAFVKHYLENEKKIVERFGFNLKFVAIADSKSFASKDLDLQNLIYRKEKRKILNKVIKNSLKKFIPLIKNQDLDVIIDGLPGSRTDAGISYPYLVEAIKNGINIICANKAPLVFKGDELIELAKKKNVYIGMSATTAGAMPTSGVINNELINAGVYYVRGILNGTSNFVLDKIMFEKKNKMEAIREAIKLGIAEPDYRFDLEGIDTCFKTIILGLLLTGKCVDLRSIPCQGIMNLNEKIVRAKVKKGMMVRLIGKLSIEDGEPKISIGPEFLEKDDPLSYVYGSNKGVTFHTRLMGELTLIGGASGLVAIGATIMKDIINLHRFYYRK